MSRVRRLTLAAVVVIGGTLTLGGVAYAESASESTGPLGGSSITGGHITPGVNSKSQGQSPTPFDQLVHIHLN
ncbi:MAG TPA: hypothetical protein VGD71_20880 [Kribbella sp.]|jgi:hypothetical protein